jgi:hypothetical protein
MSSALGGRRSADMRADGAGQWGAAALERRQKALYHHGFCLCVSLHQGTEQRLPFVDQHLHVVGRDRRISTNSSSHLRTKQWLTIGTRVFVTPLCQHLQILALGISKRIAEVLAC